MDIETANRIGAHAPKFADDYWGEPVRVAREVKGVRDTTPAQDSTLNFLVMAVASILLGIAAAVIL